MNRYEKLDWLRESCGENFIRETLVDEMVRWMGEDDFDKFYQHLCSCWEIARTPRELEAKMNDLEYDEDTDEVITEWVDVSKED